MEYNTQKIRLRFFQEIVYQAEGVEKHLMLDGDRKSDGQVEGVCQNPTGSRWGSPDHGSSKKYRKKADFSSRY